MDLELDPSSSNFKRGYVMQEEVIESLRGVTERIFFLGSYSFKVGICLTKKKIEVGMKNEIVSLFF